MKKTIQFIPKYISIIITLLYFAAGFSQERKLEKADEKYNSYSYIDARKIYIAVADKGYASSDLYAKIGDSYYFNAELDQALFWYEKLEDQFPNTMDVKHLYRYAQVLKSAKRYQESDTIMELFHQLSGNEIDQSAFAMNTQDYLHFIAMQSGKYEIIKLGINSSNSDFAPSFTHQGELVFSSSREYANMTNTVHEWNNMPFLDLFVATLSDTNTVLPRLKALKGKVNTKFHESSTTFSADGKTVYFTRNNYTKHKRKTDTAGTTLLKLYKARLQGGKWSDIMELPFNSNEYSVAHPALSNDGTQLYFASDMPGGKGLSDLYVVSIYADGTYGVPKNLGDAINTEGRETFPYCSESGRLYFASDGHVGLGGLDVFVSKSDSIGFSRPYNLGEPINSSADDFTFILNEKDKVGYFASNRSVSGIADDDIYSFKQTDSLITSCQQHVNGKLLDKHTKEPLPEAVVLLINENNDIVNTMITGTTGEYSFSLECRKNYRIEGTKKDYAPSEVALSTHAILEYNYTIDLNLDSDGLQYKEIKIGDDLGVALGLKSIYFDLGESYIRKDAKIELQKIIEVLREYPELKIDIRSHTDSRSSAYYNRRLSDRRAKSTMRYFVKKGGINASRITAKGYGESKLLNECEDGVPCSEIKHQQNRRSEFIVIQH